MRVLKFSATNRFLAAASLACALLFSCAPLATARDDNGCRRRLQQADHKLHEAIEHHGFNSPQANRWRNRLHEERERCWREHRQWWDVHENRWHRDRDWDDHDGDRDHHN